ncbi:MAG: hypothetical protein H6581_16370 [Bacteroidia bacterium]|nr:hypothetical protein [Bacteroidia bacterium]
MKFYNLYISFDPSWDTYNSITRLLGRTPNDWIKSKFERAEEPSFWWLQLKEEDQDLNLIHEFLDLLEPNLNSLEKLGIKKSDILIWLVYEYQHQCAMEFKPDEMERMGKNGITLNVDCHLIS